MHALITLRKGHPSLLRNILLICCRIGAWYISASHTADLHGLPLCRSYSQLLVEFIGHVLVSGFVCGVPVGRVVAALASFDADEVTGAFQSREAHIGKTLGEFWGEALFFSLNTPVTEIPEMDIQFSVIHLNLPLFKAFTQPSEAWPEM